MSDAPTVARLFVAVPVTSAISRALTLIQPPKGNGVRSVSRADLHFTLHFLGDAEIASASQALRSVSAKRFSVGLNRPGKFSHRNRKTVLWAGVELTDGLAALHARTGDALRSAGFEPETRPYLPHITLARLAPKPPRGLVESFEHAVLPNGKIKCTRFALYASESAAEGARYRILESYPLVAAS